jgi:hypothetical protein
MNAQPLLGFVPEQHLTVTAADQEREPVEIGAKRNRAIGAVAHEAAQRLAQPVGVSRKPVMQELQQVTDLLQRQPQSLPGGDDLNPLHGLIVEQSITRLRPPRRNQAGLVIEPQSARRQPDPIRQLRNPVRRHTKTVNLQVDSKVKPGASCRSTPASPADRYLIFAITCPFHGNAGWRWIRDHDPDGWAEAIEFDKAIRRGYPRAAEQGQPLRGQYFLHRSCQPLSEVDLDPPMARARHLRPITATPTDEEDPDCCSPWSCRSGTTVAQERAA